MKIKYDNSMYCTNPPQHNFDCSYEEMYLEQLENKIVDHEEEEKYFIGYFDIENEQICELIKNESKGTQQPIQIQL